MEFFPVVNVPFLADLELAFSAAPPHTVQIAKPLLSYTSHLTRATETDVFLRRYYFELINAHDVLFRRILSFRDTPKWIVIVTILLFIVEIKWNRSKPVLFLFFWSTSRLRTMLHDAQRVDLEHVPFTRVVAPPRPTMGNELKYNTFSYRRKNIRDRCARFSKRISAFFCLWARAFFKLPWTVWRGRCTRGK